MECSIGPCEKEGIDFDGCCADCPKVDGCEERCGTCLMSRCDR